MVNIVEEIRNEHVNMARMLKLLDQQVAVFEAAGHPDYDLIEDIVDYFLGFPEECHHPKEDLLAAALVEKSPERAGKLRGLPAQHEELSELTQKMAQVVRRVLDEAELPRDKLIRAAKEFIESQRHHMAMEEKFFLPLADELLDAGDLGRLESALFDREDPLFGPKTVQRYQMLREAIDAAEQAGG